MRPSSPDATQSISPSRQLNLTWPESNNLTPCSGSEVLTIDEDGHERRIPPRAQVTINVYNTGGSSAGGSSVGGSAAGGMGTGGSVSVGDGTTFAHRDVGSEDMAKQINDLAAKLQRLESAALQPPAAAQACVYDSGTWNTMEVRAWQNPRPKTSARVTFNQKFASAPKVIASVSSADVAKGSNLRITVSASDVDAAGFTVHADTWGDTTLYSCGVSWFAIG